MFSHTTHFMFACIAHKKILDTAARMFPHTTDKFIQYTANALFPYTTNGMKWCTTHRMFPYSETLNNMRRSSPKTLSYDDL